jgi:excisionase family DNA binding protein
MLDENLITPGQVAERLQIHERTVTRWLRMGYLRGFKLGKEWRVSPRDLQTFMEEHANRPFDQAGSGD